MNYKVFTTFLIGFLAVNVSAKSTAFKFDKTFVVDVVNQYLTISTAFLNDANSAVDAIQTDQKGMKDRLVTLGTRKGKQINFELLNGLELLKKSATDDGKAVIECIKAEKGKTDTHITMVVGDFSTCAVGKSSEVVAEVKFILARLTDFKNDVQNQTDTLSSCSKDDLTCLSDFVLTIVETLRDTLCFDKIGYSEILASISRIINDVTDCARDVIPKIKSDLQEEFNEVVVCTKRK